MHFVIRIAVGVVIVQMVLTFEIASTTRRMVEYIPGLNTLIVAHGKGIDKIGRNSTIQGPITSEQVNGSAWRH